MNTVQTQCLRLRLQRYKKNDPPQNIKLRGILITNLINLVSFSESLRAIA